MPLLEITSAQLQTWLAAGAYPLVRILGLMSTAPIFSSKAVPLRARVALGLALGGVLIPVLGPMPAIPLSSWLGLQILAQQVLIGLALGLVMRVLFAAIDLAGALIAMQMGLSFAIFFDPEGGGQTGVVSDFLAALATLLFLAVNGHLLVLGVLGQSFVWLPVSATPLAAAGFAQLVALGGILFATGLLLSLPVIGILLLANLALGALTRAAPQLNLLAVGFPITLMAGFLGLLWLLSYFAPAVVPLFEGGHDAMGTLLQAFLPA